MGREGFATRCRDLERGRRTRYNLSSPTSETSMQQRALGSSSLRVAPLCLGGNVFGWTATEGASFAVLDAFVSAGLNFIDTADVYSRWAPGHRGGESETVIGNWLKRGAKRKDLVIATKVGMEMAPDRKGLSAADVVGLVDAAQVGRLLGLLIGDRRRALHGDAVDNGCRRAAHVGEDDHVVLGAQVAFLEFLVGEIGV